MVADDRCSAIEAGGLAGEGAALVAMGAVVSVAALTVAAAVILATLGLAALQTTYALWRINWIHPFVEGNGRTARAACYYLICMRHGALLRGKKTVPERIRENRPAYYAALQAADREWANGHFNVTELATYLQGLLKAQLSEP